MRSDRRLRAVFLLAPAFVAVVGCEQILGLDQFTRSDASCEASCADGGMDTGVTQEASIDVAIPDVVNQASSWANGPMPSSAAEVEAGANPTTLANFIVVDAGSDAAVIFDEVGKKLYWNLATKTGVSDVESAANYCASLGPGWRLPTRIELVTLLDTSVTGALVTPMAKSGVTQALYWTASYVRPITQDGLEYWVIDFFRGDVVPMVASSASANVICTLGGA